MPIYVYECSSCNLQFEVQQRITEDPLRSCECGAEGTVKRLIQPIAVVFKGSGFHINDYAGSQAKSESKSESKPASTEAKSETKTESAETSSGSKSEAPAPTPAAPSPAES